MKVMKTSKDIFTLPASESEAVCITTNGIIKTNGRAVMGAGIARQANQKYHLDEELARHLQIAGNTPHLFTQRGIRNCRLISFPTKHDWRDSSNLNLIRTSAKHLVNIVNQQNLTRCYLVPPGCGLGNLDWDVQVKPVLEPLFDDRFVIVLR